MGIVFVAAQGILGFFAWRYRDRGTSSVAHYSHGNDRLEIAWTALTLILFVGLNLMSSSIWASERFGPRNLAPCRLEVTGMQFQWYFRYPGPDSKFGATKPELIDPSIGGEGAVGLDATDPASKDDLVTGTMYLPVGREAEVILRAHDVIHSFFVPGMRFKQDAVPGLAIHMHFTPISTGGLRNRLRGTLRAGTLQDARHVEGGQPTRVRRMVGRARVGEAITWLKLTLMLVLKGSSASGFSASIIKSSACNIIFLR